MCSTLQIAANVYLHQRILLKNEYKPAKEIILPDARSRLSGIDKKIELDIYINHVQVLDEQQEQKQDKIIED